ncbi:thiol:disulfide interchange protein DsbA/DsbL [Methylovorus mays]|uniref:thiol:disulfide interchange protein DsbA/DsbL n=1 Tax=Methylovorus mays TaxID=184077 RepID=UPI001E502A8D|nr:thiol:disulfide interchange protein DsbA/DsbL [Methylovorus mays]MCB5208292.1 thiol:disulfide interchange protein DsbA/DsbL [Methylovorus mays]
MKKFLAALLLLVSTHVMAADPQAGTDYNLTVQSIPSDSNGKLEVIELFWYGCPHCYQMEPAINAWVKKLPADVVFKRIPGVPRPDWAPMAKAYYAMESLGVLEKLHGPLFEAIHKQRAFRPDDEKAFVDWLVKQSGLDRKKVEEAYNSFSSNTKIMRAIQVFRASGATGVPTLIVDGKYITSSSMAGGNDQALKVADFLIAKAKQERGGK